jgi:hypothetical protein
MANSKAKLQRPARWLTEPPVTTALYNVKVGSDRTTNSFGRIEIQAVFLGDFVFPEGAEVCLYWNDPLMKGQAELWVRAGMWATPFRNGNPDLNDLCLADTEDPASRVRLDAIRALYAQYQRALQIYEDFMNESHDDILARLDAKATENSPKWNVSKEKD